MNIDLTGKVAIVCGSTKGIGKAIAVELASLGCNVTLFARDKAAMHKTMNDLDSSRGQVHGFIAADFNDLRQVSSVIDAYTKANNHVHILVNNSGGPSPGNILEAEAQDFETAFTRHLLCNQEIVKAVVPAMKLERYGRIINVISTSVKVPIPGLGVSNTIRGAVASWAKTLATELAPFGITVNNILPGFTNTDRLNDIIRQRAAHAGISADELVKTMKEGIPARRFADPAETAALAGFLASPSAAYITGTSIRVDGGSTPSI